MPRVDLVVETPVSRSSRVRQLEGMFDVPAQSKARMQWRGNVDLDKRPWNIGLILGPSGCGKSSLLTHLFGAPAALKWKGASVIDDFASSRSIQDIAEICQAVGFNTIPAWMRPFAVLSNGERFRVELARRLLECGDPIVVDEFTSVVDRQVAQIGAHAVQKFVRRHQRRFVAASCHYDIVDWLQPDWVLEPATMTLTWRELQRRPSLDCRVAQVPHSAWSLFAPFHYMSAELHRGARCFGLFVGDRIAAFAGMLNRPISAGGAHVPIMGCSRLVTTLPDYQGLGLAMALIDVLGSAYKAIGRRVHTYPAHPALMRTFDRSKRWKLEKRPGGFSSKATKESFGGRACAVFSYAGDAMAAAEAKAVLGVA